jgi:uncharacterized protein (TIGR03067 family)
MRRLSLCVALAVSVAGGSPAGGQEKDPTAGDRKRLAGAWKVVGLETDGRPRAKSAYPNTIMTFEGDTVTLAEQGYAPLVLQVKLDPAASPKAIDLISQDGPRKGATMPGIYELDGDDLRICLRIGKPARPTELRTKAGDDTELFILRRAPAGPAPAGPGWKRFTAEADGYSVEFPGEPEARPRSTRAAGRTVNMTIYAARSDGLSLMALGQKLPARLTTEEDATTVLEATLDGLLKGFQGEVVRERKLDVRSGVGREYLVRSTLGVQAVVRVYVQGDRLFILQAVGPEDPSRSADAERFLTSFQATDE